MGTADSAIEIFIERDATIEVLENLFKEIQILFPDIRYSGTIHEMISHFFILKNPDALREKELHSIIITDDELELSFHSQEVQEKKWTPTFANGKRQVRLSLHIHKHYDMTSYFHKHPDDAIRLMDLVCLIFRRLNGYFAFVADENMFAQRNDMKPMQFGTFEYLIAILGQSYPHWTTFLFDKALAEDIGFGPLRKWGKILRNIKDDGYFISRTEIPFIFNWSEKNITEGLDHIYLEQMLPKIKSRLYLEYSKEL